jgi:hypothetical protein
LKDKDDKGKKKETCTCNHCGMKGHIEVNCWKKNPSLMPEKFKGKKTEKAGAAVEEEHLLSFINVCDNNVILDTGASMMYMREDQEKVSELKTSCTSEARLSNKRHEDHDDDMEPPMSKDDVEV